MPAAVSGAVAGVIIAGFDSKFAVYVIEMPLPGFYNGMEKTFYYPESILRWKETHSVNQGL